MGHEAKEYGKFLEWFVNGGNESEINGTTWETLNENKRQEIPILSVGKLIIWKHCLENILVK